MESKTISSRDNPRIKHLKKLLLDRQYRWSCGHYVAEGRRALDDVRHATALFIADDAVPPPASADEVFIVGKDIFRQLAPTENSQGVLAVLPMRCIDFNAIDRQARYVLLDRIQDPGNMGSIMRSACAFGAKGVIITPGSVDPFAPKVVRAAAGALGKLDIIMLERPAQLQGHAVIAADAGGEELAAVAWPRHFILAVGNEANGLSQDIRSHAAKIVAVPMTENMESLNAAVAAGIILFCAARHPA